MLECFAPGLIWGRAGCAGFVLSCVFDGAAAGPAAPQEVRRVC